LNSTKKKIFIFWDMDQKSHNLHVLGARREAGEGCGHVDEEDVAERTRACRRAPAVSSDVRDFFDVENEEYHDISRDDRRSREIDRRLKRIVSEERDARRAWRRYAKERDASRRAAEVRRQTPRRVRRRDGGGAELASART
jgi:hypothetical protein